jgi:hypothetical protein
MIRFPTLAAAAALALSAALPAQADQLARSAGVPEGLYTTAELTILRESAQDHEPLTARRTLERAVSAEGRIFLQDWTPGAARIEAPRAAGPAQLAAAMGVDPADHTTAELADMFIDAHD